MTKDDDDIRICNITPLLGPQVSHTCKLLAYHVMDYFGHHRFHPIALASESSDRCGSIQNAYRLVSLVWNDQQQWDYGVMILDHHQVGLH